MRILAALVLGYYMVVGRVGAELGGTNGVPPTLPTGMTDRARNELDRALGLSLSRAERREALEPPRRRVTRGGRVISIAEGCASVAEPYDLVIHFHGAPPAMEAAVDKSGVGGVLAILNLGNGSGKYEDAFQSAGAFPELLTRISEVVAEMCPGASRRTRRIALTAWSAGYGAVWRIIDRSEDANRVDSVLLADGLHAGFEPDKKAARAVNAAQMAAFTLWMERAVAGEKLMAITHSAIATPYASTTETASFLLAQENVPRVPVNAPGPRAGMQWLSRADRASLHVLGFAGEDKPAHCDHLHAIGDTLFPLLRERWSR
ncbi:MAG TPA: hypothetical protein VER33_24360 [Polyangiaceae bacterium]|nr:hypothetical protein [Polyangiaceae bacterium]